MNYDLALLWKNYKKSKDSYYRNKLISIYKPYLNKLVNFIYFKIPKILDRMDLENYAYIGLLDAINKFDIKRNIKFETYASYRIKGAIIDGLRKNDWLPKNQRKKLKDSLDSDYLNIENDNFEKSTDPKNSFDNFFVSSLDDSDGYERKVYESMEYVKNLCKTYSNNCIDFTEQMDNYLFLKNSLKKLTPIEKKVIFLYYFKGKTLKKIGDSLNLTESRVSQIHKKIIEKIRAQLNSKKVLSKV